MNKEPLLLVVKNLTEFEFIRVLFLIKIHSTDDPYAIKHLKYILSLYDLSNKEITKILEEYNDPNDDFDGKIERSLRYNKKDNAATKARKLGKHCKRVSTENKDKRKNVKYMHIYKLLKCFNFKKILSKTNRTVIHLDNVRAHKTDLVLAVAKKLNIKFVNNPIYTPRLNPTEKVWDIIKKEIRRRDINSKEELISISFEIFEEKCKHHSLIKKFKEKYLSYIS